MAVPRSSPGVRGGAVAKDGETAPQSEARRVFAERHYTIAEIAALWCLSKDAVRRLFAKELGVLVLGHAEGRAYKRRYTTLRIPESVVERVHRRCSLVR